MGNELLVRDMLLLAYKAFDGNMRGKTLLQKRVYFLSVVLDVGLAMMPTTMAHTRKTSRRPIPN
jgi:hypothetical protein